MSDIKEGVVHWFDDNEGEGSVIESGSGESFYFHYSAIDSNEKFKKLKAGEKVKFKIYENRYMKQVDFIKAISKRRDKQPEM